MIRTSKFFGAVIAAMLVLAPAAVSFAQDEEEEGEEEEGPSLWESATQTVTEAYQEMNNTEGDSQSEQIMDDLNNQ